MKPSSVDELAEARRALAEASTLLEAERAARIRAERASAMKDEFVSRVSHQLRNPLGVILGWAHLLRRRGSQNEFEKGLDAIEQSAQSQVRLIDELLDICRMTSGQIRLNLKQVEPRSFIDAAVEAIAPAAQAREIRIRKVLDLAVGPVRGDPQRLQQVMTNLLLNAVQFTPEKGSVEVALRGAHGQAEISVADSGVGIQPAELPHLFDWVREAQAAPARRTGGLQLGLAITRHLVELHGGQVRAESAGEGRGATFVVRLPLAAEPRLSLAPDEQGHGGGEQRNA